MEIKTLTKLPPQNVESEKALLGSILLNPYLIEKISKKIKPEYFYDIKHRITFYALVDMFNREIPIDLLTLTDRIKKANKLDEIGGTSFLVELTHTVPSSINVEHYADVIKSKYKARITLKLMEEITESIYEEGDIEHKTKDKISTLNDLIDVEFDSNSQNKLLEELEDYDGEDKVVTFKEIYDNVNMDKSANMYTGWEKLDKIINGIRPSHLIVLAGLMKSGKTTFSMDMSTKMQEYNPLWLAIEETIDELMIKFKERGEPAPNGFSPKSLAPVTIKWIEKKIAEGIKKFKTKIVFIDNLSWIKLSSKTNTNKADILEETMIELKALAKKWNVVIVIISHVNGEASADKNPTFENLKGSSGIGQVGDKTLIVWRECKRGSYGELNFSSNVNVGVQLNRQGGVGNVKMIFDKGHYSEYDWVQDDDGFGDFSQKKIKPLL
jgi:replicative DNA helicase